MKKPISIKLDESLWVHIKNKTNKSAYISELIKQDIQAQQTKPIVDAVRSKLLEDEVFVRELSERLKVKPITNMLPTQLTEPLLDKQSFVPRPPNPQTGYPCCQLEKPCKHWVWNSDTGEGYVNSITGEIRVVLT